LTVTSVAQNRVSLKQSAASQVTAYVEMLFSSLVTVSELLPPLVCRFSTHYSKSTQTSTSCCFSWAMSLIGFLHIRSYVQLPDWPG